MRVAAIDIGTVTTRLLIADVTYDASLPFGPEAPGPEAVLSAGIHPKLNEVVRAIQITQLGAGLSITGVLGNEGMRAVFSAIDCFNERIAEAQVDRVVTVATSAARDAQNAETFAHGLRGRGLEPQVIPGEREAELSFLGATYNRPVNHLLVMDPGGGSTEYTYQSRRGMPLYARSIDVGSRRLTDMFINHDPASPDDMMALAAYVHGLFELYAERLPEKPTELLAVAGTATTLVTMKYGMKDYDPARVQGAVILRTELQHFIDLLCHKTQAEREQIVGLDPKRAPVMLAGCLIIAETLDILGLPQLTISDNDILAGIIIDAALS